MDRTGCELGGKNTSNGTGTFFPVAEKSVFPAVGSLPTDNGLIRRVGFPVKGAQFFSDSRLSPTQQISKMSSILTEQFRASDLAMGGDHKEPLCARLVCEDVIPRASQAGRAPHVIPVPVAVDDREGKTGGELRHPVHVPGSGKGVPDHRPLRPRYHGTPELEIPQVGFHQPESGPKQGDLR